MRKFLTFLRKYLLFFIVLGAVTWLLLYYLAWHEQPFTQNAFIFANTRPVSALVEGFITEIHIKNNQAVKKGDPLFTVFRPPYSLKVDILSHQIAEQKAKIAELDSKIDAAKAEVKRVDAELANNRYLSNRAGYMYAGQAVSQTYAEERLRAQQASESQLEATSHLVTSLTHSRTGAVAALKKLESELELAKIYLELTIVRAMSDGIVTNMSISPGGYYKPGDVLFGFIDTEEWFIQANFKESELSEIHPGQEAKIWLWQYPGKVFHGVVEATGWSAERRLTSKETGLPVVEKENEWFLLPQRFPVQIRITDPDPAYRFHPGASAFAQVNTPARPVRQFFWQFLLWD